MKRRLTLALTAVAVAAGMAACTPSEQIAEGMTEHVTSSTRVVLPEELTSDAAADAPAESELALMYEVGDTRAIALVSAVSAEEADYDGTPEGLALMVEGTAAAMTNFTAEDIKAVPVDVAGAKQAYRTSISAVSVDDVELTGWIVAAEHPDGRVIVALALSTTDFPELDALLAASDSFRLS